VAAAAPDAGPLHVFYAVLHVSTYVFLDQNGKLSAIWRRWTRLDRLVYVVAGLGVWHYWWLVKKDIRPPLAYAGVFAMLIGYRVGHRLWRRADRGSAPHGLERSVQLQEQRLGAVPADARVGDR
jgi:DMSO/TMAO reductase YedYZ heme-binding membrane subunit